MAERTCANCKSVLETTQVCSRCKKVYYCSRECQRTDWKSHKSFCSSSPLTSTASSPTSAVSSSISTLAAAVFKAASNGNSFEIRKILSEGVLYCLVCGLFDIHNILLGVAASLRTRLAILTATLENGETPLLIAAGRGAVQTVKTLIEFGADVNEYQQEGGTPLHWCVAYCIVL